MSTNVRLRETTRRAARFLLRRIPFAAAVALLHVLRVRFLVINHFDRIGHLAVEPDCYIKEGLLQMRPAFRTLLVVPPGQKIANDCLLRHWRGRLTIVRSQKLAKFVMPFASVAKLRYETDDYTVAINTTARVVEIQNGWRGRAPLLRLSEREKSEGRARLAQLGVPRNAWFVAVHCRESGYAPGKIHDFRNADIETYMAAMRAIVARGGWCIRMGDSTMKPLPAMEGVIDYAHSPAHSAAMDVFLCAEARFMLANTSGLYIVASVFGVPAACANIAPMSALSYAPEDVNIPKLVYSEREGRYLTFKEIFDSPVANFRFSHLYEELGLRVEDSAEEDIRAMAKEMLDRVEGKASYTAEDENLQTRFKALFRPGHYSYGAKTRVGRDFLRKYEHLFGD